MAGTLREQLASGKNTERVLDAITSRIQALEIRLAELRPLQEELNDLKAAIVDYVDGEYKPTDDVDFEATGIKIEVSSKDVVRTIKDMKALYDHLGRKKFLAAARFPMKELDRLVSKEDQRKFVTRRREGARTVKITLLSKSKSKGNKK